MLIMMAVMMIFGGWRYADILMTIANNYRLFGLVAQSP